MFEESIWKSRTNWTKTLDELAAEQAKTLDKRPLTAQNSAEIQRFSESKLLTATEVRSKIQDSGGVPGESVRPKSVSKKIRTVGWRNEPLP